MTAENDAINAALDREWLAQVQHAQIVMAIVAGRELGYPDETLAALHDKSFEAMAELIESYFESQRLIEAQEEATAAMIAGADLSRLGGA